MNAVEDGRDLAQACADRLGKVKLGAASIGFARLDGVDVPPSANSSSTPIA